MASLPPSSSPVTSSLSSPAPAPPRRPVLLDPFSGNARSGWKAPNFAKRERSPDNSPNSSPVHKRVRRVDDFATSSPFGTRNLPASSSPFGSPPRYAPAVPRSPYKESIYEKQMALWSERISEIFNHDHETRLDLSDQQLPFISPEVGSLGELVRLLPINVPDSPTFSRSISLPTNSPGPARVMQRVSTAALSVTNHAKPGVTPIQLFLSGNRIKTLPAELFRVENLTVLTLRNNGLTEIPPAIGALKNLEELVIGGNQIKYLPAEIEKLPLRQLGLYPNKWLECPENESGENILSPLETHLIIPTLAEHCIRVLLSFPPGSSGTQLEQIDELYSDVVPHHYLKYFKATCPKVLLIPPVRGRLIFDSPSTPTSTPRQKNEENDPAYNLKYSVCPNREHGVGVRKTFINPAEIRYRWVKKIGSADTGGLVPLQYRGCEPHCLDFLEDAFTEEDGDEPGDDDLVF